MLEQTGVADTISAELRQLVTTRANGNCEYCQSPESFATERFSIEHIEPRAAGGFTIAENLALACQGCNGHKAAKTAAVDTETRTSVAIFNPRQQRWQEHFAWSEDHLRIIGLTPIGRATLRLLHLNRNSLLNLRKALISINAHPPRV
ncbi:MAG: HNH endonuclease [Cyanobacteria bacterium 13_1_40CM_2_61_4]|nr:MAG: HNH endonuclease [Cyanobacteria bacterium 13_1_40CM_2_61_4]